jgi:hypothetical protein
MANIALRGRRFPSSTAMPRLMQPSAKEVSSSLRPASPRETCERSCAIRGVVITGGGNTTNRLPSPCSVRLFQWSMGIDEDWRAHSRDWCAAEGWKNLRSAADCMSRPDSARPPTGSTYFPHLHNAASTAKSTPIRNVSKRNITWHLLC